MKPRRLLQRDMRAGDCQHAIELEAPFLFLPWHTPVLGYGSGAKLRCREFRHGGLAGAFRAQKACPSDEIRGDDRRKHPAMGMNVRAQNTTRDRVDNALRVDCNMRHLVTAERGTQMIGEALTIALAREDCVGKDSQQGLAQPADKVALDIIGIIVARQGSIVEQSKALCIQGKDFGCWKQSVKPPLATLDRAARKFRA